MESVACHCASKQCRGKLISLRTSRNHMALDKKSLCCEITEPRIPDDAIVIEDSTRLHPATDVTVIEEVAGIFSTFTEIN